MRVLIVGSVRLYREGLASELAAERDIDVATAVGLGDAVRRCDEAAPDVVLVDLMQDGIEVVRQLCKAPGSLRVVALSVRDAEDEVIACAEAGVAGYVTREASLVELVHVVISAARGESVASPRMTAALLRRVSELAAAQAPHVEGPSLTRRERQVLDLIERGLTNKEIGLALHIELATVKNHIHHILDKLQVKRRSDAAERFRAARTGSI